MSPPITTPHPGKPTRRFFDPWNSSSTGHQRADNRLAGSTSWRDSRSLKLGQQFGGGSGGGPRVYDTVGAGSEEFGRDGRLENGGWEKGAKGLRGKGQMSLVESFGVRKGGRGIVKGKGKGEEKVGRERVIEEVVEGEGVPSSAQIPRNEEHEEEKIREQEPKQEQETKRQEELLQGEETQHQKPPQPKSQNPQIFSGLCIYINGSTSPTISDHKLKSLLVTHGARISISLGRRTVTHVILGRPNNASTLGAGGGLSSSKLHKEITKIGGNNIKYVTVEWVMESLKAGKRVQENRFEAVRLAQKGTGRVGDMFAKVAAKKG